MKVENETNERLDLYLSKILDLSRTRVSLLIKQGNILVNDKIVKSSYIPNLGDEIEINIPETKEIELKSQDLDIEIVYEDKYLAVINKKAGMVVHPSKGHSENTLVNALLFHLSDLSGINGDLRPGIVHRLDKNTSGLIIVAKNDKTHNILVKMFKDRKINKIYYAIVKGKVKNKESILISKIGRNIKDRKKMSVVENGKEAITKYTLISSNENYSLLKLKLETGRTHQIRVHLSHFLFPILGDEIYGRKDTEKRQMLHAYSLEFIHPITNKEIKLVGKFHYDFLNAIRKCGLSLDGI